MRNEVRAFIDQRAISYRTIGDSTGIAYDRIGRYINQRSKWDYRSMVDIYRYLVSRGYPSSPIDFPPVYELQYINYQRGYDMEFDLAIETLESKWSKDRLSEFDKRQCLNLANKIDDENYSGYIAPSILLFMTDEERREINNVVSGILRNKGA